MVGKMLLLFGFCVEIFSPVFFSEFSQRTSLGDPLSINPSE